MPGRRSLPQRLLGALLGLAFITALSAAGLAQPAPTPSAPEPDAPTCIPRDECCKVCRKGKACGNTCIRESYTCHKGQGCACNAEDICD